MFPPGARTLGPSTGVGGTGRGRPGWLGARVGNTRRQGFRRSIRTALHRGDRSDLVSAFWVSLCSLKRPAEG